MIFATILDFISGIFVYNKKYLHKSNKKYLLI